MNHQLWIDLVGWVGVAALLLAYGLVSAKKIAGDSFQYQALNLLGGALLIVNSYFYGAFPSVAVNIAWIGIAIFTLARTRQSNSSASGE